MYGAPENNAADKCRRRINVFAQEHGRMAANNVPDQSAGRGRDHAHDRGHDEAMPEFHRLGCPNHGEQGEADSIDPDQGFQPAPEAGGQKGCETTQGSKSEAEIVTQSKNRLIEEKVAQRAAPDGRKEGHDDDAEQVHVLAHRRQPAAEGEDEDAGKIKHSNKQIRIHQHSTTFTASPPWLVSLYLVDMSSPVWRMVSIT